MEDLVYWPYDEVVLLSLKEKNTFKIDSPWLKTNLEVPDEQVKNMENLVQLFKQGSLSPDYLNEINWLFKSLSHLPFAYILPRVVLKGKVEVYELKDLIQGDSPRDFLNEGLKDRSEKEPLKNLMDHELFNGQWKWDHKNAVTFSKSPHGGVDPYSLFSVARRFHLLSSLESNTTSELYDFVKGLDKGGEQYKNAAALMVRQNHFVTQNCDQALKAALDTAQTQQAYEEVQEFIAEESGHDKILAQALKSFVDNPDDIAVMDSSKVLMDLLSFSGKKNFLAFALTVDFFERSPYQDSDPLAQSLSEGGLQKAADQIDKHKDINDAGEHENVALGFLKTMAPVSEDYAIEALKIAELVTYAMCVIPQEVKSQITKG